MSEELDKLLELSNFDKKAYNLRKSNRDLPKKIKQLEEEINNAEAKLKEINDSIDNCREKIKQNKIFTEEEGLALEVSSERLNSISTNKEYDAIHSEIATHKRNIEDSQANTLHLAQVLENLKNDKEDVEKSYAEVNEQNAPQLAQLLKELDSLEGRISKEVEKSAVPRKKLSKRTISVYDRTVTRRKTPYIISIINWENKVCEICNRTQPPQKINELRKSDIVQTCETCGSILVWKESPEVSANG